MHILLCPEFRPNCYFLNFKQMLMAILVALFNLNIFIVHLFHCCKESLEPNFLNFKNGIDFKRLYKTVLFSFSLWPFYRIVYFIGYALRFVTKPLATHFLKIRLIQVNLYKICINCEYEVGVWWYKTPNLVSFYFSNILSSLLFLGILVDVRTYAKCDLFCEIK